MKLRNNKNKPYLYKKQTRQTGGAFSFLTGDIATAIKNALPASDASARPSYRGELHGVLQLANGKNGIRVG